MNDQPPLGGSRHQCPNRGTPVNHIVGRDWVSMVPDFCIHPIQICGVQGRENKWTNYFW